MNYSKLKCSECWPFAIFPPKTVFSKKWVFLFVWFQKTRVDNILFYWDIFHFLLGLLKEKILSTFFTILFIISLNKQQYTLFLFMLIVGETQLQWGKTTFVLQQSKILIFQNYLESPAKSNGLPFTKWMLSSEQISYHMWVVPLGYFDLRFLLHGLYIALAYSFYLLVAEMQFKDTSWIL